MARISSARKSGLTRFIVEHFKEALAESRLRLFNTRIDSGEEYSIPSQEEELDEGEETELIISNPEDSGKAVDVGEIIVSSSGFGRIELFDNLTEVGGEELQTKNRNGFFGDSNVAEVYGEATYNDEGESIYISPFGTEGDGGDPFGGASGGISEASPITTLAPGGSRLVRVKSLSEGITVTYNVGIIVRDPGPDEEEAL